ncbi:hypothetical protein C7475_10155 [Chitinophaga sp. S165]|nr:hypothetical protein C7475_10155 [Chitinophaga sp. S165]
MKKFKLMFTAAAVFAIVGTALAVKPTFGTRVCLATIPMSGSCANVTCSGSPVMRDVDDDTNGTHCYAQVPSGNCTGVSCTSEAIISVEDGN